jgi:hypothetical protein
MVIIPPPIFDLLFYIIVFLFGLDFSISGFLVLREGHANFKMPRLVGLWIIRRMSALPGATNRSKLFSLLYSTRNQAIQGLVAGLLLIFASLVMIVEIGVGLF